MPVTSNDPALDFDPLGPTYTTDAYGVGKLYEFEGCHYRFCRVLDSALVVGDTCVYATTPGSVTPDATSAASATNGQCAGIAIVACAVGGYCFLQCSGFNRVALATDDGVDAAGYIMIVAANDGTCLDMTGTNDEHLVFGMSLGVDASNALAPGKVIFKAMV